ncbi:sensor histidine kinase [Pseudoxanthomonas composti]|nr:ATP-binding protein [Pseudoxanthomonas composti]
MGGSRGAGSRRRAWLLLWAWLLPALAWAGVGHNHQRVPEMPRFRTLTVADGLPSDSVLSVATDADGYVWVATIDGLARFDGVDFSVWRHEPGNPDSLPANYLQWVYPDQRGRVFVAPDSMGVAYLETATGRFHSLYNDGKGPITEESIYSITGSKGEVWFAGPDQGVWRLRADGGVDHYTKENTQGGLPSTRAMVVGFDLSGRLWAGTDVGIAYFDGKTFVATPLPVDGKPLVFSLSQAGGYLWAGTSNGVFRMGAKGVWETVPWSAMFAHANMVWNIGAANDGGYWIGSPKGLWRTHGVDAPVPVPVQAGAPVRTVSGFARAPNGGLWLSQLGLGLSYLRSDWQRMASYVPQVDTSDGVHCNLIRAKAERGLWQFDREGRLEHLDQRTGTVVATPWTFPQLARGRIAHGTEDGVGGLWLITLDPAELVRIDLETGAFRHWTPRDKVDAATEYVATQVLAPGDGTVWVRSPHSHQIQVRDARSGRILRTVAETEEMSLSVFQMSSDPQGRVWISNGKMARWDDSTGHFKEEPGLGNGASSAFAFADADHLWLHGDGGLQLWERSGGGWRVTRTLAPGAELPEIESVGMQLDPRGRIWLATRRGLFRINPHHVDGSFDVRLFGVRDGMRSQEFTDRCLLDLGQGILAGAFTDGSITLLDTALDDPLAGSPPLKVEQITVMREGRRIDLPVEGGFRLRPDDRELQVDARVLAYDDPLANQYRTRLSGFDPGWVNQGNSGTRMLSSLRPGDYRLDIQGIDATGNVSSVVALSFSVAPPWYASAWGVTLLLLSGLLLILGSAWAYRRRLRRRAAWLLAEHKREVAEQASLAKTRFLATLGHEVRTPMTGVLGMSELLLETELNPRQRGYAAAIQSAGKHLLRLVNDALDLARIEAGKLPLDQQDFELRALVEEAAVLVRPMAERKRLAFDCQIAAEVPQVLRGDPARLRQILLNLLLNAVKFTEHGRIGLSVAALQPEGVRFEISDTGPGVSLEQQARIFQRFEQAEGARTAARYGGSGLGLAICHELAVAMGGQIQIHSVLGQGTRFTVELPLAGRSGELALAEVDPMRVPPEFTIRILLVEDDPTVADVIRGLLESRGHQVDHAVHGLAAMTEVAMHHYQFALLDLDLPGLDGLSLARQLRAQGFIAPMLAVTARADVEAESLAMEAGFDGFLRKPLTGALLLKAMRAAWMRRQSDQASA